jgi:RNA polymerase sigma-70 factor (ECF subfamily)
MPDEKTDDILTRLRADDKAAFKELFQEYYLFVCKTIHRFIRDRSTVEDLAQEVFIRFWDKRQQIDINSSLSAYIRRMAINEALAYLRRNKRLDDREMTPDLVPGTSDSAEEQFLHQELETRVRNAINGLPPRCRTVFQLSRYEELTYQEIADQMEISIKTVENQMGKALRILREQLRSYLHLLL